MGKIVSFVQQRYPITSGLPFRLHDPYWTGPPDG